MQSALDFTLQFCCILSFIAQALAGGCYPFGRLNSIKMSQTPAANKLFDLVHYYIEHYLGLCMTRAEIIKHLHDWHDLSPQITEQVLERLEKENPELFDAYETIQVVKNKLKEFNGILKIQMDTINRLCPDANAQQTSAGGETVRPDSQGSTFNIVIPGYGHDGSLPSSSRAVEPRTAANVVRTLGDHAAHRPDVAAHRPDIAGREDSSSASTPSAPSRFLFGPTLMAFYHII